MGCLANVKVVVCCVKVGLCLSGRWLCTRWGCDVMYGAPKSWIVLLRGASRPWYAASREFMIVYPGFFCEMFDWDRATSECRGEGVEALVRESVEEVERE